MLRASNQANDLTVIAYPLGLVVASHATYCTSTGNVSQLILPISAVLEESVSGFRTKSPSFSNFQELAAALSYAISSNMSSAMCVAIKFLACIALLIFARGGIPRFRFDYLTKLGWIRFLSLVLLVFLLEILIINTF